MGYGVLADERRETAAAAGADPRRGKRREPVWGEAEFRSRLRRWQARTPNFPNFRASPPG